MHTATLDPTAILPLHAAIDQNKLTTLTESMKANGWVGAPIVVVPTHGDGTFAATGSHRLAAAREAEVDVPTIDLDDILAEQGITVVELIADHGDLYNALVWCTYNLPADVVAHYGLDAH